MLRVDNINASEVSDGQLLVRLRDGHDDSFGELVRRHRVAAMSVARRALPGDLASAEDAVEDAVDATLRAIRNGKGPDVDFRPYFLAATRTAAVRISGRRLPTATSKDTRATDGSEFATADSAREFTLLNECFHRLRPAWRQMLWQVDVDGVPSPTVADQLGVSRRSVDAVCQRARRHLARDYVAHLMPVADGTASCASLQHHVSDYGLGLASETSSHLLESHLEHCPACSLRVEAVRRLPEQLPGVVPPAAVGAWKLLASLFMSGGAASLSAVGVACLVVVTPIIPSDQSSLRSQIIIDSRADDSHELDRPADLGQPATVSSRAATQGQLQASQSADAADALTVPTVPTAPGVVGVPLFDVVRERAADVSSAEGDLGVPLPGVDVSIGQTGVSVAVTVGPLGVDLQPTVSINPTTAAANVGLDLAVTTPVTTIEIDVGVDLQPGDAAHVDVVTNVTVPLLQLPVPTVSIVIPLPPVTLPSLHLF